MYKLGLRATGPSVAFLLVLISHGLIPAAIAGDTQTWGGSRDELGVAREVNGDLYFVGFTTSFNPQGSKVLLLKYGFDGALRWSRVWAWAGGDFEFKGVAIAPDGRACIAGAASGDVLAAQFDASGNLAWARTWDSGQGSVDWADGVAIGSDGSVYLGGGIERDGGRKALVAKFTGGGVFSWARTWQRGSNDSCNGVAVDPSGNVYCGGNSRDAFDRVEALLVKFAPSGALSWAETWRSEEPGALGDDAFGLEAHASGDVVLVGGSDSLGEAQHLMVLRFRPNGDEAWARIWGRTLDGSAGTNDGAALVHIDGGGNVYTGSMLQTSDAPPLGDALLLKFDAAGDLEHAKAWGGDPTKAHFFASFDASDAFALLVGGGTSASTGALRNVYREAVIPADRVTRPSGIVDSRGDGGSPTPFAEVSATGCVSPPCGGLDALLLQLTRVCVLSGTDPSTVDLSLVKGDCASPVTVPGRTIQVIRGRLDEVGLSGGSVDLGFIECVGHATGSDRVEDLSENPARGSKGYFYLARNTETEADFGSASSGERRDTWTADPICP